jgi:type IV pilus assembly protein PilY1
MVTSTDPCSGEIGAPVTYGYVAQFVSGTATSSCGYLQPGGAIARATKRTTTAPPTAATVRVTLNKDGKAAYGGLNMDAGSDPANKTMGVRDSITEPVYWLEVPRDVHGCRHVSAAQCQ